MFALDRAGAPVAVRGDEQDACFHAVTAAATMAWASD
jgi:hypothetical protein